MNYQKLFDTIGWAIIVICAIIGFATPLYFYDVAPNNKEVSIQLLPGEIPPNAVVVFDMRDIEIVGEAKPKQVFGTYDFYGCNQTYVSASLNRQKNIIEFFVRGTAHNETFDYQFHKDIGTMVIYDVNDISLLNSENVVVRHYKTDTGAIGSFFGGILLAMILGAISCLIIRGLEIILKSNPVQGMYRGAKRFTSGGKKK